MVDVMYGLCEIDADVVVFVVVVVVVVVVVCRHWTTMTSYNLVHFQSNHSHSERNSKRPTHQHHPSFSSSVAIVMTSAVTYQREWQRRW